MHDPGAVKCMTHKWVGCVDLLREPQHWNLKMVEISKMYVRLLYKGLWNAKSLMQYSGNTTLNTKIIFKKIVMFDEHNSFFHL